MVRLVLLPALLAAFANGSYTWTKCTSAPRCAVGDNPNGSTTTGGVSAGTRFNFVGSYVFAYDTCTNFSYERGNGYWYSHEKDGLFVSPEGYLRTAHDCNLIAITGKSADVGTTFWYISGGGDCCLPDSVGTNIYNLEAYYTGA